MPVERTLFDPSRRVSNISSIAGEVADERPSAWSQSQLKGLEADIERLEHARTHGKRRRRDGGEKALVETRQATDAAELSRLRHQVRTLRSEVEEGRLKLRKCEQDGRVQHQALEQRAERLDAQAGRAIEQERALRDKLQASERRWLDERQELTKRVRELEDERRAFEDEIEREREAARLAMSQRGAELEAVREQYAQRTQAVEELEAELSELHAEGAAGRGGGGGGGDDDASAEQTERLRAALGRAERRCRELESRDVGDGGDERLAELVRQLGVSQRKARSLEQQAERAQAEAAEAGTEVASMRAEVASMRQAQTRAAERRDALLGAEAERDELLRQKREWEELWRGVVGEGGEACTARHALETLRKLRAERTDLEAKAGELQGARERSQRDASTARAELDTARQEAEDAGRRLRAAAEMAKSRERRAAFLESENLALLRVIDCAESGRAVTAVVAPEAPEDAEGVPAHVKELQEMLRASWARVRELEQGESGGGGGGGGEAAQLSAAKAAEAEEALKKLSAENESLRAELGKGRFDPASTKVLHLALNPTSKALEQQRKQRQELATNEQSFASASNVSVVSEGQADLAKRNERLKTLFREKTKAFKEAVYLLTGYKVDMTQDKNPYLRLRSMYAEKQGDELRFQWVPETGGLELLETDLCRRLDDNIFAYLTRCNSVPAFLATLTLELFERQTFTTGAR